ncbi:rhodanese-like domain-containing protein [Iodobacter fluviatilis]|uniref:Molybdopterin biosynthesis protein MoeB n=1 Tax=Iodobacter fluviatilis TaxID=537 RepID=A0A377QAF9_9NEIS|nr:rhodanese-like domain-containing protein [Iodobacter fluviatilis]TCU81755.1 rhodanese-related sulfurtransferase [Iodobacter fluviatilis]STQ91862.1 molybdopterin biosynthesis protein MoeB [Iodobacter fluviatilis]
MSDQSAVKSSGLASPAESAAYLAEKLRFHTDAADLASDLYAQHSEIVALDTRSSEAYERGHIPGAISFPHRLMDEASTARLDRSKVYVCYCDGIGCNGSTWGSYKLAKLGFMVKELIGGLDFWQRDGHPIALGAEAGVLAGGGIECDC